MARKEAVRYRTRDEQERATRADCERRFEALFGRPWDPAQKIELQEWLSQDHGVAAEAHGVLVGLRDAITEAQRFFEAHPMRTIAQRETRAGLRAEVVAVGHAARVRILLDSQTAPLQIRDELRAADGQAMLETNISTVDLLLKGCGYSVALEDVLLRCEIAPMVGGPLAATLHCIRAAIERFDTDTREAWAFVEHDPVKWDGRTAVAGLHDRTYGPGELRERLSTKGATNRLTTTELAIVSILAGNFPNMPKSPDRKDPKKPAGYSVAEILDREARAMGEARKQVEAWRAAGVPVPRILAGMIHVGTDAPQPAA